MPPDMNSSDSNAEFLAGLSAPSGAGDRRLVLPEGANHRMLEAARLLQDGGIARISLLGDPGMICEAGASIGLSLNGMDIIDPGLDERAAEFAGLYRLGRPRTKEAVALKLVRKPLFFAGMMVRSGAADAMLAGAETATARVVEAGLMTVGLAQGITSPSSFFLMLLPERPVLFADCALSVDPSARQLAEIAIASARSYSSLFDDPPRVAMLSFSTKGSARHALVDKVRQALEMARDQAPELLIDGEMQLDTALDPDVVGRKISDSSPVAGQSNVLVFPDLNSGNIAYKLARHLTGAAAIGPVLQGFEKPVGDLSRGASVDEIIATARVLLTQLC
jgi:phosphate acetyltransferase